MDSSIAKVFTVLKYLNFTLPLPPAALLKKLLFSFGRGLQSFCLMSAGRICIAAFLCRFESNAVIKEKKKNSYTSHSMLLSVSGDLEMQERNEKASPLQFCKTRLYQIAQNATLCEFFSFFFRIDTLPFVVFFFMRKFQVIGILVEMEICLRYVRNDFHFSTAAFLKFMNYIPLEFELFDSSSKFSISRKQLCFSIITVSNTCWFPGQEVDTFVQSH